MRKRQAQHTACANCGNDSKRAYCATCERLAIRAISVRIATKDSHGNTSQIAYRTPREAIREDSSVWKVSRGAFLPSAH